MKKRLDMMMNWMRGAMMRGGAGVVAAWMAVVLLPMMAVGQSTSSMPAGTRGVEATSSAPAATASAPAKTESKPKKAASEWVKNEKLYAGVTRESVRGEIEKIFAMGPRAVGQTGHGKVRQYVRDELTRLKDAGAATGAKMDWREQQFFATAPVDLGRDAEGNAYDGNATLKVGELILRPYAVYPNVVAPSVAVGESGGGVTAAIVDGGDGSLRELDGKVIKGAIVVLTFNSDKQWENAAKLGARAVVFKHPETTTQAQAAKKFFMVPLEVPRYLLSEKDTKALEGWLKAQGEGAKLEATLKGGATWDVVPTSNILALVPGKDADPKKSSQLLVIQVYMDSMCVAPAAPHGADTSLQLIAGLNMLRGMMRDESTRPSCSVLFAFTDAHSQALQGARQLAYVFWRHGEQIKSPSRKSLADDAAAALLQLDAHREALNFLDGSKAKVSAGAAAVLVERINALASRGSMLTAKELQAAQRVETPDQGAITYLKRVRDWYAVLKETEGAETKASMLRKGVPAPVAAGSFPGLQLGVETLREVLTTLVGDWERERIVTESDAATAKWMLDGRDGARIQGLFLEIAPGADQVSWAGVGSFGLDTGAQSLFPNMHAAHVSVTRQMAKEMKLAQSEPLDDSFSIEASSLRGNILAPQVSEGNPMVLAGLQSFGLVSMNVNRSYIDTPLDVPSTIDVDKATESIRFVCGFVPWLANDLSVVTIQKKGRAGPLNVRGRVVRYDLLSGVSPNEPVPGALAYFPLAWLTQGKEQDRTVAGVRYAGVQRVNQLGQYAFRMIPDNAGKSTKKLVQLFGFRLNDAGSVDFALDNSAQGTELLTNRTQRLRSEDEVAVVVAPSRPMAIFDLIDPRTLTQIGDLRVLNATSLNKLDNWSFYFVKENAEDLAGATSLENCGIVYAPAHEHIVAMASAGLSGTRATYLNLAYVTEGGKRLLKPRGFYVKDTPRIDFTALQVARDMVLTNEDRLGVMEQQGIRDKLLAGLTKESRESLDAAEKNYAALKYSDAYREATHAWGVALRAYTPVRNLGKDAVLGSVFFMALCLPFAFFMERLTIRAKNPNWRVVWTILWFSAIFAVLFAIHPAFKISLNPMIVLLAFVMVVLVLVVASIVYRKFAILIREYRNQLEGVHGADIKRFSAGGVALNLSLSTMARRKARTMLTAATLTMLAFAIVTFSSVASRISSQSVPIANVTPTYSGVMFRMPNWVDMPSSVVDSFVDEFGDKSDVLPRMWKLRSQDPWALGAGTANTTMILRRAAALKEGEKKKPDVTTSISGVVGVTPGEAKLFDVSSMLEAGTWLRPGHPEDMVIGPDAAKKLGITDAMLGTAQAKVFILEQWFTVVGIVKPEAMDKWADLDGENFAPADYAAAGIVGTGSAANTDLANLGAIDVSHRTPHLSYGAVAITTLDRTKLLQGVYKGVAVKFGPEVNPEAATTRLLQRLKIPVFAGVVKENGKSEAALVMSKDSPDPKGFGKLVIPVLLAIFMIVNTLLGTVEERKDEIGMLNSVGLAPAHVGMLFLVEAIVYGVIGLVCGYMMGLLLAKVLLGNATLMAAIGAAGVSLNYSSSGTIVSCVLVLVIVVLSALYPAKQAKKMATPGAMARWALPESDTGDMSIEVPFTLTGGNALGMIGFLDEYLAQHTDATSPDFRVMRKQVVEQTSPDGKPEVVLEGDAFLAPYDLGVSNTFQICVRATDQPNILRVRFAISRLGGDMNSYRRATQKFLDLLRRQFLIWRTLELVEKQKYVSRTLEQFGETPAAGVVPPAALA